MPIASVFKFSSASNRKIALLVLSVAIYWVFVSLVPVYNKHVFNGKLSGVKKFSYPLTTTFMQLGFVSVVMGLLNVADHLRPSRRNKSWIFGPEFLYKMRTVSAIGFLFGIKYGITNWGLKLLNTDTHLLLQSTDIVWTFIAAHFINKERVGMVEIICCFACLAGSVLLALRVNETVDGAWWKILVNLISPLLLGLCIATLRKAAKTLLDPYNTRVRDMSAVELTSLKLLISTLAVVPFAIAFEGFNLANWQHLGLKPGAHVPPAFWTTLREDGPNTTLAVLGGGFLVAVFQWNITWMSGMSSALFVGLIGGAKIVPQWLIALWLNNTPIDKTWLNIFGAVLCMTSCVFWAAAKYAKGLRQQKQAVDDAYYPMADMQSGNEPKITPLLHADMQADHYQRMPEECKDHPTAGNGVMMV